MSKLRLFSGFLAVLGIIIVGPARAIEDDLGAEELDLSKYGVIYIYRIQKLGFKNQPPVYLNGRQATQLQPKRYSKHIVAPGELLVSTENEQVGRLTLNVEPGQTYYIRGKLSTSLKYARPQPILKLIDHKTALKELKKCRERED